MVPDHLDQEVTPSVGLQYAIQRSVFNAQSSERNFVAGPHVLIALFAVEDCHAAYFLEEAGVMRIELMEDVSHTISDEDDSVELEDEESEGVPEEGERSKNPLKQFCTLLNEEARAGRIDPIVGRADEIARCIHIFYHADARIILYWLVKRALAKPPSQRVSRRRSKRAKCRHRLQS